MATNNKPLRSDDPNDPGYIPNAISKYSHQFFSKEKDEESKEVKDLDAIRRAMYKNAFAKANLWSNEEWYKFIKSNVSKMGIHQDLPGPDKDEKLSDYYQFIFNNLENYHARCRFMNSLNLVFLENICEFDKFDDNKFFVFKRILDTFKKLRVSKRIKKELILVRERIKGYKYHDFELSKELQFLHF